MRKILISIVVLITAILICLYLFDKVTVAHLPAQENAEISATVETHQGIISPDAAKIIRVIVHDPAEGDGTIRIDPIPAGSNWDGNDTGATEHSIFSIRIDRLDPIMVSTQSAGTYTDLALNTQHLADIHMDGKRLTSFQFTFEQEHPHLKLWYNPFYGTWSLTKMKQ